MTGRGQGPILIVLAFGLAPHLDHLPVWVVAWCAAIWLYVWLAGSRGWPRPRKSVKGIMIVVGLAGATITYGGATGREMGVAMLAVMLGLKPLESSTHRDRMVTLFLSYFLVLANLLYSQTLAMAAYLTAAVALSTVVLVHLHHPGLGLKRIAALAGRMVAQAAPLAAILFMLFPRLPGGLIRLPEPGLTLSGISDTMSPGDVAQLVQNREIAFRAEFEGAPPPNNLLYWRALALWQFDGRTWRRQHQLPLRVEPLKGGERIRYTLAVEPHSENWLPVLDMPVTSPDRSFMRQDFTIYRFQPLVRRTRFSMGSYPLYSTADPDEEMRRLGLQLPAGGNPKARALAAQWAEEAAGPEEIVRLGLEYFRENEFFYTLRPPLLGPDSVDDFLFGERRGYCEHYASALAFLLRAAGVPARAIIGYQGGEFNDGGGYMIVRQSDAHAWVEAALPGRGWVRFDPTAEVAPERIERGMEAALPMEEFAGFFNRNRLGSFYQYWLTASMRWDQVNYFWYNWVMDYTYEKQKGLLDLLGVKTGGFRSTVYLLSGVLVAAGLAIFAALFLISRARRKKRSPAVDLYAGFCRRLSRVGLDRRPYQGPEDFAREAALKRPDLAGEVRTITDLYVLLRYAGRDDDGEAVRGLRRAVRAFRPRRKRAVS
jgi:transglutaminase-like putative cysteine protease